ncbi:IS630 family transposase [Rhizophagus irregularis DAOM 181602=DAOM 197198]|nr:IS630 family transposase [Rhizophagus irregularis DAOM 181602=DAOM 197198]
MTHYTELSPQEKGKILAYMENFNPAQIARKMGRDPTTIRCVTTAKQTLYDAGIHSHVAAIKPFISKRHASARISWCEKYKEKTARDWAQVIFSDESSIEIGKQSRQIRVWRHTGERFNTECLTPTFKSGRKSVMEGNEKINSNTYVRILNKHLHPFHHTVCELTGRAASFQQDNAPIHTMKITKDWLKKNKISREVFPRTVGELKATLSEEWENLDCSVFEEVDASMPQRINAVLEAKGGSTHY